MQLNNAQSIENRIHQVEVDIEEAKEAAALGHAVKRLLMNADFKKVVIQGYLRDHAARLVGLMSAENINELQRAAVTRDVNGIGGLERYLSAVEVMGSQAEVAILEHENERVFLQEELVSASGSDLLDGEV